MLKAGAGQTGAGLRSIWPELIETTFLIEIQGTCDSTGAVLSSAVDSAIASAQRGAQENGHPAWGGLAVRHTPSLGQITVHRRAGHLWRRMPGKRAPCFRRRGFVRLTALHPLQEPFPSCRALLLAGRSAKPRFTRTVSLLPEAQMTPNQTTSVPELCALSRAAERTACAAFIWSEHNRWKGGRPGARAQSDWKRAK